MIDGDLMGNLLSTIVGGLIGFGSSYFLQIHKDKKEYIKTRDSSRRLILSQITYSLEFFDNQSRYENSGNIFFLDKWPEYLENADFDRDERTNIFNWFRHLIILSSSLSEDVKRSFQLSPKSLLYARLDKDKQAMMVDLIEKYKTYT